jgi:hypothetical protein
MVDGHETLHELSQRGAVFEHDARNPKVIIPHGSGQ